MNLWLTKYLKKYLNKPDFPPFRYYFRFLRHKNVNLKKKTLLQARVHTAYVYSACNNNNNNNNTTICKAP